MDSSHISFSGIKAAEAMISSVSDNISNLNTNGYKVKNHTFKSLISAESVMDGQGVVVSESAYNFSPGKIISTGNEMDIAVDGDAFIELVDNAGKPYLGRGGRMQVSPDGYLQMQNGYYLSGMILVPSDISDFKVTEDGYITGKNSSGHQMDLGIIDLVKPVSSNGITEKTGGVFFAGPNAGSVVRVSDGSSKILQKSTELSNVDLTEELVKLMLAQNMYKANSNVININSTVSQWLSDLLQV